MLHALLHRKLYGELKRHPRDIEDLLTSVVFGACAYSGSVSFALLPFLAAARTPEGILLSDELGDIRQATFEFWPSWDAIANDDRVVSEGGEPDLLLRLGDGNGPSSLLLVEAKLWSGKSSRPSAAGAVTDQLAKYWLGLQSLAAAERLRPIGVVYLTSGTAPPVEDLEETQRELERKGHGRAPLYWISWRQFPRVVDLSTAPPVLCDAVRLLRDEWQLIEAEMGDWPTPAPSRVRWTFDGELRWPRAPRGVRWMYDR